LAQYLERQYNASFNYPASDNIPNSLKAPANVSTYYGISVTVDDSKQTYIIEAEPTAQQNDSQCGTLTLNEQGVKSPTTSGCWK
jgi:type IV pilus assembly protein PilE